MGALLNNMGLKKTITKEEILSKIDDEKLFNFYLGEFDYKKSYSSVFRTDDTPSCGIYINKRGRLIYNDIAKNEKLDIFAFVAKKFNISYQSAIQKIAEDFKYIKDKEFTPVERVPKDTKIDIQCGKWSFGPLEYWKRYTITQKELEENNVFNVRKLYINNKVINNFDGTLRFAYTLNYKGKILKKIYQPEGDKMYKWITNIPLHIPFGYDSLKFKSDNLIITKSVKEMIIFKRYFTDVIALQNESSASLRDVTIDFLLKKYKNIYLFFDGDSTGILNSKYYETKGLKPIYIPEDIVSESLKDSADMVKIMGIAYFENFLKSNKLL